MTSAVRSLGVVLHPLRDIAAPVNRILAWAENYEVTVLGLNKEIARLNCRAVGRLRARDGGPGGAIGGTGR